MPLPQLQQLLVPGIVVEPDWKRFWDQARRELRKSKAVVVPTARTQSICLVSDDKSRGEDWYVALAKERDLEKLITRFEELAEHKPESLTESERGILAERYAFLLKGATTKQVGITARALAAGSALGLDTPPGASSGASFFEPGLFQQALKQMQVRASRILLRYMETLDKDRLRKLLQQVMPAMEITAYNESMTYLLEAGADDDGRTLYRKAADTRSPSLEMLHWLARNMERIESWSLGAHFTWVSYMLDVLEREFNGERLKAQNQLRERFGKSDWLRDALAKIDADQRRQVVQRLRDAGGWEMLDRKSVLGQILKLYPELQELMVEKDKKSGGTPRGPVTSRRSYEERRAQLQRIISFEVPKVAKDIAHARSYGDLRENFEYKAAKEAQAVLLRKRDELEQMLRHVSPTDFEGLPTDRVGLATGVVLAYDDGRTERYYILGEWDTEQTLGIISSESRMAKALEGKRKDETVTVPTEDGETSCRIADVTGMSDEVRAWSKAAGDR
jgi:transcription elongation GreA/GreB family factor